MTCSAVVQALILSIWLGKAQQLERLQTNKEREHALCMVMTRCLTGTPKTTRPRTWLYRRLPPPSPCFKTTRTKKNWLGDPVSG